MKRLFHISWVCCLLLQPSHAGVQPRPRQSPRQADNLAMFVGELERKMPHTRGSGYIQPSEADLHAWSRVFSLFRQQRYDSCRAILDRYHYALLQLRDNVTGSVYDVIKEDYPVRRGWGTFFYNRNHAKRLYIHVSHPVDDPGVLRIGAELFRRSGAEWLLVAGTTRHAGAERLGADIARARTSVFQRWHELLTDLTHVTLSLHAYHRSQYGWPISGTDVILSNGKTSDEQWGISQLSLSVRDTLRGAGLECAVAMYDSGYAVLAAGGNPQAIFSNDSVGFGHWMNVELSNAVRGDPGRTRLLIAAADRGLELTGKRVSRQINRAFGLVSPRVVRLDSAHGMMFPPTGADTYRIIALAPEAGGSDTIDIRMGNWFGFGAGSGRMVSSVTRLDTGRARYLDRLRGEEVRATIATRDDLPHRGSARFSGSDTLTGGEADPQTNEPLQVHRIPLEPLAAARMAASIADAASPFEWRGIIAPGFAFRAPVFTLAHAGDEGAEAHPEFLIPLLSSSFTGGRGGFVGIRMTSMLVKEITRLVTEHRETGSAVGLLAEQSESGDYYLRIFPERLPKETASLVP